MVIDSRGHVLLVKHTYMPGWHIPGGRVEKGESLEQAALREVEEETGLNLQECSRELFSVYYNAHESKHDHIALFVIRCPRPQALKPRFLEIESCDFFPPDKLPIDTTPATRRRLTECFEGGRREPLW